MPTLTIRNVPEKVVTALKEAALRNRSSMEQEARDLLARHTRSRQELLDAIRESWKEQTRPVTAEEIDRWKREGRP